MQPHQQAGAFLRPGRVPEVLASQLLERKLGLAAAFPQKRRVNFVGDLVRLRHELRQRQVLEADQHRRSFHLGALAVQGFDLQRRVVVG